MQQGPRYCGRFHGQFVSTVDREHARQDWSRREVELIVADYMSMLGDELAGRSYSKSAHNEALRQLLPKRSRGSIEFKHQNISAVLIGLGYPYIEGYKPRSNFQVLLREIVEEQLEMSNTVSALAAQVVSAPVRDAPGDVEWSTVEVDVPTRDRSLDATYERLRSARAPRVAVNYLEREARNASLGAAGEHFVLSFEHRRLWTLGQRTLANKVEHVARTRGDGLGYDILSFEPNGRERLIEVKTTRFGNMTPFYATQHEVEVSGREHDRFHLYRVFRFTRNPQLFVLKGSLRETVVLDPIAYRASLP